MTIRGADLHGLVTAVVMPFRPDGAIDWDSYARVLDHCAAPDMIRAVFVNGHAGEGAALDRDERSAVIRATRDRIGGAKPLLAGIIAFSTADAIAEARIAESAGADVAVLFPPPSFAAGGAATPDAPLAFVQAVMERITIPVSIFQQPVRSGLGFTTETLVALAKLDRCVAIKEGSDDITIYETNWRALRDAAADVAVLPSNFEWFMPQLAIGGHGILSGLLSLVPHHLDALWQASARADLATMRAAADRLHPIVRSVYGAPRMDMHTRIKAGLRHLGIIASDRPRGPLLPIGASTSHAVEAALAQAGVTAATA